MENKEYGFLPLCIDVAKTNPLKEGKEYFDGENTIKVVKYDTQSPTRVNKDDNHVEINPDTKISFSGKLHFLVWCFVRGEYETDSDADITAFIICSDIPEFNTMEMFTDFISVLSTRETEENVSRIRRMKEYIEMPLNSEDSYQSNCIIQSEVSEEILVIKNNVEYLENNMFLQDFRFSVFTFGTYKPKPNVFKRIKLAFRYLIKGTLNLDQIVISADNAAELAQFIISERIETEESAAENDEAINDEIDGETGDE